jgi:hypothetical protein
MPLVRLPDGRMCLPQRPISRAEMRALKNVQRFLHERNRAQSPDAIVVVRGGARLGERE